MKLLQGMSLSSEAISFQKDDYATSEILPIIRSIYDIVMSPIDVYNTNKGLSNNKRLLSLLKDLDKKFHNRLGINFNITLNDGSECYCMPVTPGIDTALLPDINESLRIIESWSISNNKDLRTEADKTDNVKLITSNNYNQFVSKMYTNAKQLSQATITNGLTIDREKAIMYGVPDTVRITVSLDLIWAFKKVKLLPEELLALLLHEIGHAWTVIEYSIRSMYNVNSLLDALKDSTTSGRSPKETVCYLIENLEGNKNLKENLKDKNVIVAYLTLGRELCLSDNKYASVDSEQLADQFVVRFGMSDYLASGLHKAERKIPSDVYYIGYFITQALVLISILIMLVITIFTSFTIAIIPLLAGLSCLAVGLFLKYICNSKDANNYASYDDRLSRVKRIKFDLIRLIRSNNFPKEIKINLLKQLDGIERVIALTPKNSQMTMEKFASFFRIGGTTARELEKIDKCLEALTENDLHAVKARLELINKG